MNGILSFTRIEHRHQNLVGGKALALATLMCEGITVPEGLCVATTVYENFVRMTGLGTRRHCRPRIRPALRHRRSRRQRSDPHR